MPDSRRRPRILTASTAVRLTPSEFGALSELASNQRRTVSYVLRLRIQEMVAGERARQADEVPQGPSFERMLPVTQEEAGLF